MARSSDMTRSKTCFLQHQLVKPASGILVVVAVGLLSWVAVQHLEGMQLQSAGSNPMLGVEVANPDAMVARMFAFPPGAVLISNVIANSAADQAGLQRGDGIARVNNTPINSTQDIASSLGAVKRGDLLSLTVVRGGLLHELMLPAGGGSTP